MQGMIQTGMDDNDTSSLANDIELMERLTYIDTNPITEINGGETIPQSEETKSIPAFVWAIASATAVGVLGMGAFIKQRNTKSMDDEHQGQHDNRNNHHLATAMSSSSSISNYTPVSSTSSPSSRFPLSLQAAKGYSVQESDFAVEVEDDR